jgi:DNA-binding NtrC family response regulator
MVTAFYSRNGQYRKFDGCRLSGEMATTRMSADEVYPNFDVLVVDDDPAIRELIMAYFHSVGMRVAGAHDGRAAIAALQRSEGRYGLIVTDLNLPGADGFAVLQAARQANACCYVVIVTGYASLDSAIHAVRVGAYDYLTKPFSIGQLDLILRRITDRAALVQENRQLVQAPNTGPPTWFGASRTPPAASDLTAVERRITAIESTLARIESRLR